MSAAGIPVGVLAAPIIPLINDLEEILKAGAGHGATMARYIFIRLPHEVKTLFRQWLDQHFPQRADHVMSLIRQSRGGKDYDPDFNTRMVGTGLYAETITRRYRICSRKLDLDGKRWPGLDCSRFQVPDTEPQLTLF